jgi:hypothetical protein
LAPRQQHCGCQQGAKPGALGWTYLLTIAFIVLYLGEHYAIDLAAALALAEGVRRTEPLLRPLIAMITHATKAAQPRPA